jgi:biotin carboxyl carrier protein
MKKLRITVEGRTYDVTVDVLEDDGFVFSDPAARAVVASPAPKAASVAAAPPKPATILDKPSGAGKDVLSQVSGMIVAVDVVVGDQVNEGQQLITIEAMKMNTYVMAPFAGKVTEVLASKGKSVLAGDVLVRLS